MRAVVEDALRRGVGLAEDGERSVGRDLDLGERHQPLRQHPLARVAAGQLRHGRQLREAPQHELGRGVGIVVGKAPDAGRDPGHEHRGPEGRRHGAVLYDRLGGVLQAGARRVRHATTTLPNGTNGVPLPRPLFLWLLRVAWVTLPVTAGPAASASLASWSDGPRVAGAVLLWVAWALGLLATLAPRPIMLTALRVDRARVRDRRGARRDRR